MYIILFVCVILLICCIRALFQIITAKKSKRRLSLSSSEDSEADEREYQEEDAVLALSDSSQLLDDFHLQQVSCWFCVPNVIINSVFLCSITF